MRRFAFFFACSPWQSLKDIHASFSMLEGRCNRHSEHCSRLRTCSKTSPLSHLYLLPTPRQCSIRLQASSSRQRRRRPSPLSPHHSHTHLLKPYPICISHTPHAH